MVSWIPAFAGMTQDKYEIRSKNIMNKEFSILLSGVGGQGLVLLSNIIGTACVAEGLRVVTGEQHGLSQRSGTISIHLRIGEAVRSPLIPVGSGDAILALEALEALRYVEYLKPDGIVFTNSRIIHPVTETKELVGEKTKNYMTLDDVKSKLAQVTKHVAAIDALQLANQAGNALTENIVMLGALSVLQDFPVPPAALQAAMAELVPQKAKDENVKAFALGAQAAYDKFCNELKCRKI